MTTPDPTRMLLLRHGESRWNAMRRWQGLADSALTARGREQARNAADALAAHPLFADHVAARSLSTIWASTLSRAHQTAALIAAGLRIGEVRCDARLVEADAGPWQGLTPSEIEAGWPGFLASAQRPEGFEPASAIVARVHEGLLDVARRGERNGDPTSIVVIHSGVIRTLLRAAGLDNGSVPNLTGWFVDVDPTGVVPVEPFDPGAAGVDRRLTTPTLG